MAVTYFPFNSIVVDGVPDRPANAKNLAAYLAGFFSNGVLMHADTALQVKASSGMNVQISAGVGNINGKTIHNDATETISLAAANASLSRIDRVVFRLDETNRLMEFGVLTGTPASSPTAPELTQTANVYELCLADIRVPAGATSIIASYITDKRTAATLKALGLTATAEELNILDGAKIKTGELNILSGVTVSATEINLLKGITSNIQTQLDSKAKSNHNHDSAYAKTNHNHDGSYLKQYGLNAINIDSTGGNWTVDISEEGHGTIPTPWVNVTQTTGAHFIVQTAIKCDSSTSTSGRDQRIWIRDKYSQSGVWSNWREVLTENRGVQMVKLWENGNPSSSFAEQNISVSTNYDFIMIAFLISEASSSGVESTETVRAKVGGGGLLLAGDEYAREFGIQNGQIRFSNAWNRETGSGTSTNKYCVPVAIYGIKGVQ